MRLVPYILIFSLCAIRVAAQPQIPALNWVERSDWVNVKTDITPGAKGDGSADDTAAIQKAFDAVKDGSTIYFPPGTYRITTTLTLKGPLIGVLVIGHGRDTRLVWDGEEGGTLFLDDGVAYSRFVGIALDGRNKAAVGFCHFSKNRFETEVRHEHMAFANFTDTGLLVDPKRTVATAETLVANCLFENCRRGSAILQFNEYDFTYDGCEFRDCEIGIQCAHGNFYARNCHFERSRNADLLIGPEHGCSIRRCTSYASRTFIQYANPVAPLTIQDCHVEGWTNPEGAIFLSGAPVILFDCVFTRPPGKEPPVKPRWGGQRLIVSENVSRETGEVVPPKSTSNLYVIPAGKRNGIITSAMQRFLKERVSIPTTVFDAKRDFGAKGDGVSDDTAALQRTIDAARAHGKGAIAYLPTGIYVTSATLRVTGANYYVGGSGFRTCLRWKGPEGGTMVEVRDTQNVTLENIAIGNHDSGQMNNAVDILQTSSGKPSYTIYDNVYVFGMYQKQPFRKGLWLQGLGKDSVVLMRHVQGNIRLINSARATILANTSYEGSIVVEGKDRRRDGFLGFLTRLGTICTHALYIKDNHSIVMSDFYIEQADNGLVLEGGSDDPAGRVTIQGAKLHFNPPKKEGEANVAVDVRNYKGKVFIGHEQFYVEPVEYRIRHAGRNPLDLFLLATCFYSTRLAVEKEDSLQVFLIGNMKAGSGDYPAADIMESDTLTQLSEGLDDLRTLGEMDIRLNHTNLTQTPKHP